MCRIVNYQRERQNCNLNGFENIVENEIFANIGQQHGCQKASLKAME